MDAWLATKNDEASHSPCRVRSTALISDNRRQQQQQQQRQQRRRQL